MKKRKATAKVSVSIDNEALAWLDKEDERLHINRSRVLNQLIYAAMFEALEEPKKVAK